jgi:hypothetical protein
MRTSNPTNHTPPSAIPPDPAELAMAAVGWRRTGLLQRLVKVEREAQPLPAEDRSPAEEAAARSAA